MLTLCHRFEVARRPTVLRRLTISREAAVVREACVTRNSTVLDAPDLTSSCNRPFAQSDGALTLDINTCSHHSTAIADNMVHLVKRMEHLLTVLVGAAHPTTRLSHFDHLVEHYWLMLSVSIDF